MEIPFIAKCREEWGSRQVAVISSVNEDLTQSHPSSKLLGIPVRDKAAEEQGTARERDGTVYGYEPFFSPFSRGAGSTELAE